MVREKKRKKWQEIIESQKKSGISQIKWCEENNVNIHNFRYWVSRLNASKQPAQTGAPVWASVTPKTKATSSIKVSIGCSIIELDENFNPEVLDKIMKVLSRYAE